jgi:hypothetical protein
MKLIHNSELFSNLLHIVLVLPFGMTCVAIAFHIAKAVG